MFNLSPVPVPDLSGRVVLVTGAGKGIGAELVRILVAKGAKVFAGIYPGEAAEALVPLQRARRYGRHPLPHLAVWLHANAFLGAPLVARWHKQWIARLLTGEPLSEQEERDSFAFLASADYAEGLAAFSEKRPPKFTGK